MASEQEDEEAFLEGITNPSGLPSPHLALKVKLLTARAWSPAILIRPGQHTAGLPHSAAIVYMPAFPDIVNTHRHVKPVGFIYHGC